jgi:hypothetical protein
MAASYRSFVAPSRSQPLVVLLHQDGRAVPKQRVARESLWRTDRSALPKKTWAAAEPKGLEAAAARLTNCGP